jgi:hypothetical protein
MRKKILMLAVASIFIPIKTEATTHSKFVIVEPGTVNFGQVFIGQSRLVPVYVKNLTGVNQSIQKVVPPINSGIIVQDFIPKTLKPCNSNPCDENSVMWFSLVIKPSKTGPFEYNINLKDKKGITIRSIKVSGKGARLDNSNSIDVTAPGYGAVCRVDETYAKHNRIAFQKAADAAGKQNKFIRVPASKCGRDSFYALNGYVRIKGPGVIGVPHKEKKPYIKMFGANGGKDRDPSFHTIFSFTDWKGRPQALFSNLHLDGGWNGKTDPHTIGGGEWDHIFDLRFVKNVRIENNLMTNPWGDCIYIGGGYHPGPSDGVLITNNKCLNPWRTSVGLISANHINITHNYFYKPNGGPSVDGLWYHFNIDMEPNLGVVPKESVWNVEVAYNKIISIVPPSRYQYDVGIGIGLSYASTEVVGGNINVHDNIGTAPGSFFKSDMQGNGSGQWLNSAAYRNANPRGCWKSGEKESKDCALPVLSVPVGAGTSYKGIYLSNITGGGVMPAWDKNVVVARCTGDGVSDDFECLQKAANEARDKKESLVVPYKQNFYKISKPITVFTSVGGISGMPKIRQFNPAGDAGGVVVKLGAGMSGWVYNLHLIGTYAGSATTGEWAHNIDVGSVKNVTIKNNILENAMGDGIGTDASRWDGGNNISENIIIDNNTILDPYRCGIGLVFNQRNWLIVNNVIEKKVNYVSGIDFETEGGTIKNIEVAYNKFIMNSKASNPSRSADGRAVSAWQIPTAPNPGGNLYVHHNYGTFGTGMWMSDISYKGGMGDWYNVVLSANFEGNKVPR